MDARNIQVGDEYLVNLGLRSLVRVRIVGIQEDVEYQERLFIGRRNRAKEKVVFRAHQIAEESGDA